jgi:predicted dehydrogenase
MKTLRAGVIGTGFIGPAHVEALRRIPGVRITAIGSIDSVRARGIADQFAIPRVYEGWAELVRDPEVDVIHNCTPNNLHFEINRAAVLEGKHVISEKPLTMTPAQSAKLVTLVRRKGVVNAVNFNYRFYPLIQHARAMVRKGQLGETYLVHGHYLQDWLYYDTDYNWRLEPAISGVSRAVADIGSHWLDLIQFVTGRKVTRVCATLKTIHRTRKKPTAAVETFKGRRTRQTQRAKSVSITTEDAAIVMFDLDNGGKGVVTLSQVSAGRKNREWFEIDGSKAAIAWNQEEPNKLWVGRRDSPNETVIKDPALLDASARKYAHYPGGHPEGYPEGPKNLFTNVYEFIRSGRDPRTVTPEFPTFADGHRENLIVQAVLASSRSGQWVNLPR